MHFSECDRASVIDLRFLKFLLPLCTYTQTLTLRRDLRHFSFVSFPLPPLPPTINSKYSTAVSLCFPGLFPWAATALAGLATRRFKLFFR